MNITLDAARNQAAKALARACELDPAVARIEARALARHALDCDDSELLICGNKHLSASCAEHFFKLVDKRSEGQPIAHIVGSREFYGLEISCSPAALIPRPETELLVDLALEQIEKSKAARLADFGCGSGAIAAALASLQPQLMIDGYEIDPAAHQLALANTAPWSERITIRRSSWSEADYKTYCGIVANPPYLTSAETRQLRGSHALHDPQIALDGGQDGLAAISCAATAAYAALDLNGWLVIEHGAMQQKQTCAILAAAGFSELECFADLAGCPRAVVGHKLSD